MRKHVLLLSITFFLGSLLSCENNSPEDVVSGDMSTKTITATDVSGKFNVKLRLTSTNEEILKTYNDKSFLLSFAKPTNSVPADDKVEDTPISESVGNIIDAEIIEANLPKGATGMLLSFMGKSSLRTTAARMITVNLFAMSPKNYLYVYNSSSAAMTVLFAYNKSTSSSSGWVSAGTKSLKARQETGYCKQSVKQIRATVTYDANSGSYSFFTWQYFVCP